MAHSRKFDHEECRRLRAEGMKFKELRERFGVSQGAIDYALRTPDERKKYLEYQRDWRIRNWQNPTPEERAEKAAYIREWRRNRTPEQLEQAKKYQREYQQKLRADAKAYRALAAQQRAAE